MKVARAACSDYRGIAGEVLGADLNRSESRETPIQKKIAALRDIESAYVGLGSGGGGPMSELPSEAAVERTSMDGRFVP
jgi:hypothetical protein